MIPFGVLRIRLFMAAITGPHSGLFIQDRSTDHLAISSRGVHIAISQDGTDTPGPIIDDHDVIAAYCYGRFCSA
jgi:hypothetical protein